MVATERTDSDSKTLWAATRRGRVFVSKNADAAAASVTFKRIDTRAQPRRFVSGISIDPANANHAWVSFSGYNAYTPTTPGHVFEVLFNPVSGYGSLDRPELQPRRSADNQRRVRLEHRRCVRVD